MKILIVNEFYYPYQRGGAEVSTQLLAEELVRLGHSVVVCCSNKSNFVQEYNGVKIYNIKTNPVYWGGECVKPGKISKIIWHILDLCNPFIYLPFNKILKKEKPNIVHTNNLSHFSAVVWFLAKKRHLPVCHTIRDYYLLCHKCTMFKNGKNCNKQCFSCRFSSFSKKFFSSNVDAVVGISNFVLKTHLKQNFFRKSILRESIFNPVSVIVKEITFSPKKNIGFIGSLHPSKGVEALISSFKRCNTGDYSLKIAGAGSESYVAFLKKMAGDANIEFVGKVVADDFYKQIDLLVVPAVWNEPFGRIVVESVAAGVPVMASRKGGISEILKDSKVGLLYDDSNPRELDSLLQKWFNGELEFDLSDKYSFLKNFENTAVAKKYVGVYRSLVKKWELLF